MIFDLRSFVSYSFFFFSPLSLTYLVIFILHKLSLTLTPSPSTPLPSPTDSQTPSPFWSSHPSPNALPFSSSFSSPTFHLHPLPSTATPLLLLIIPDLPLSSSLPFYPLLYPLPLFALYSPDFLSSFTFWRGLVFGVLPILSILANKRYCVIFISIHLALNKRTPCANMNNAAGRHNAAY